MDLPSEVVLQFTLQPGAVYLFKHDAFPDHPHYFVVLNKEVNQGDVLYMVCASSKLDKREEWVQRRRIPSDTLVYVEPGECSFLKKRTVFDCNAVYPIAFEVLKIKLDSSEVLTVQAIDEDILSRLRDSVKKSPLVLRNIKKLL